MATGIALGIVIGLILAIATYLVAMLVRSIVIEKKTSNLRKTWTYFGLSLAFCVLFFASWIGQGIAEWQVYVSDQHAHHLSTEVTGFVSEFAQSTLENWQSEFLQLFSFVVLSALLIHRGSAESKDSDDRIEEALQRIERQLGTAG